MQYRVIKLQAILIQNFNWSGLNPLDMGYKFADFRPGRQIRYGYSTVGISEYSTWQYKPTWWGPGYQFWWGGFSRPIKWRAYFGQISASEPIWVKNLVSLYWSHGSLFGEKWVKLGSIPQNAREHTSSKFIGWNSCGVAANNSGPPTWRHRIMIPPQLIPPLLSALPKFLIRTPAKIFFVSAYPLPSCANYFPLHICKRYVRYAIDNSIHSTDSKVAKPLSLRQMHLEFEMLMQLCCYRRRESGSRVSRYSYWRPGAYSCKLLKAIIISASKWIVRNFRSPLCLAGGHDTTVLLSLTYSHAR